MLRFKTLKCIAVVAPLFVATHGSLAQEANGTVIDDQYRQQVKAIGERQDVRAAYAHLVTLEPQHRADLIELTEIPAPPFKEEARALRFAEMLREAGLTDVRIDEIGNAVGRRPGRSGDRVVGISAHLDTVFPEGTDVTVRADDDTLYAPGIADNSRGLVAILGVLRALQETNIDTEADLLFIGNVGEEGLGDLRGVKHLFREGAEKIDSLLVIDGGDAQQIVFGGVGSHRYRVTFNGPGGHSWGAFGTANPQHALARAIALFDENAPSVTGDGPKSSYNVGRIGGGTSINSVPFDAWAEIDIRSGDQARINAIDEILKASVERALQDENSGRSRGPALTVDVARVGTRPAANGSAQWPLVQRSLAATAAFGIDATLTISSTDANLPISKGIPAVTMSRGGISSNGHAPTESWQNSDGPLSLQIALLTLLAEAGVSD